MKKVAVFGNAGAGKSTTSKKLAALTGLELYVLDKVKFSAGGAEVPHQQYLTAHAEILAKNEWLIDGYGCLESTWTRLAEADTLVYIDLPIQVHFWWVSKRFLKGLFQPPQGWPENTPLLKSTINSYRVLWLCHKKLTPAYRKYVAEAAKTKTLYHLRSKADIASFLQSITKTSR
ncbi:adenylate kinase [Thalassomonas viridans]|uniref:Adenylate kinase n=1 Tax=Thalassomonas viridans TaxID=137584 RepID=A0AAE9Z455_9GAMM|nr:adenylate kinase [Thalassomonas viridans]WDE06310.1 adenylate kinase [Thalassomonas viridans]